MLWLILRALLPSGGDRVTIVITDDTTRADLAETLALLNAEAKAMRRRGYTGTRSPDYAAWHARIDAVLEDWQRAKA